MVEKKDAPKKEETTKVVKNASKGYGYTYSNLADLAKAGVKIPKMRTTVNEFGRFVEYLDDNGEWQLGAEIIVPDMKGMNAAQAYGSALTYARRYTVQLAESVACDDDDKLENHDGAGRKPYQPKAAPAAKPNRIEFDEVWKKVKEINNVEELGKYWSSLRLSAAQEKALKPSFTRRKEELEK